MTYFLELWRYNRKNIFRGCVLLGGVVAVFGGVSLIAYLKNTKTMRLIDTYQGEIISVTRVPTPGSYASAPSLWEATVRLTAAKVETVQFVFLPTNGTKTCIAEYSTDSGAREYKAIGYMDALDEKGFECSPSNRALHEPPY